MVAVCFRIRKSNDPMLGTQLSGGALAWHVWGSECDPSLYQRERFHKVNKNHLSQTDHVYLSIQKADITDSPKSQPKAKVIGPTARRWAPDTVILAVPYQIHSVLWPASQVKLFPLPRTHPSLAQDHVEHTPTQEKLGAPAGARGERPTKVSIAPLHHDRSGSRVRFIRDGEDPAHGSGRLAGKLHSAAMCRHPPPRLCN